MQLLECFGWLLGRCYAATKEFWDVCQGVSMQLLECCGWLPGGFYAVTKVFWVVARALLYSY